MQGPGRPVVQRWRRPNQQHQEEEDDGGDLQDVALLGVRLDGVGGAAGSLQLLTRLRGDECQRGKDQRQRAQRPGEIPARPAGQAIDDGA